MREYELKMDSNEENFQERYSAVTEYINSLVRINRDIFHLEDGSQTFIHVGRGSNLTSFFQLNEDKDKKCKVLLKLVSDGNHIDDVVKRLEKV